jgi:hypothetical protein
VYAFGVLLSEIWTRSEPYAGQPVSAVLAGVADLTQVSTRTRRRRMGQARRAPMKHQYAGILLWFSHR